MMIYWAMFSCSKISDLARFETTLAKISENIKNCPKNLKNVSPENLGKNKKLPALGKSQRSL